MFLVSRRAVRAAFFVIIALDLLFITVTASTDVSPAADANRVIQLFELKREANIAVWFSSALLFLNAMYAFAITGSRAAARNGLPFRLAWSAAGFAFLWLSLDETAQIHEKSGNFFTQVFGRIPGLTDGRGYGVFAWLLIWLPAVVAFVVVAVTIARIWLAAHPVSRRLALAAVVCWVCVIGAEFVEAELSRYGFKRSFEGTIEEGLELAGSTLFLVSFHKFLTARRPGGRRQGGMAARFETRVESPGRDRAA